MNPEYYVIQYRYTGIPKARWHTFPQHHETIDHAQETMAYFRELDIRESQLPTEYRICAAVRTVRLVPIKEEENT